MRSNDNNDNRCRGCEIEVPEVVRSALAQMFGVSVDEVKVYEHSRFAELHGAVATTRENAIYLSGSGKDFLADSRLMLEEYYHVVEQWNTGEITVVKYVLENITNGNGYYGNRFEIEAKSFARDNVWRFESLKGN